MRLDIHNCCAEVSYRRVYYVVRAARFSLQTMSYMTRGGGCDCTVYQPMPPPRTLLFQRVVDQPNAYAFSSTHDAMAAARHVTKGMIYDAMPMMSKSLMRYTNDQAVVLATLLVNVFGYVAPCGEVDGVMWSPHRHIAWMHHPKFGPYLSGRVGAIFMGARRMRRTSGLRRLPPHLWMDVLRRVKLVAHLGWTNDDCRVVPDE